jgi:hypothetical protein
MRMRRIIGNLIAVVLALENSLTGLLKFYCEGTTGARPVAGPGIGSSVKFYLVWGFSSFKYCQVMGK